MNLFAVYFAVASTGASQGLGLPCTGVLRSQHSPPALKWGKGSAQSHDPRLYIIASGPSLTKKSGERKPLPLQQSGHCNPTESPGCLRAKRQPPLTSLRRAGRAAQPGPLHASQPCTDTRQPSAQGNPARPRGPTARLHPRGTSYFLRLRLRLRLRPARSGAATGSPARRLQRGPPQIPAPRNTAPSLRCPLGRARISLPLGLHVRPRST